MALKSKAIHEGYIYIGPASLCPCPGVNTPFLVVTGDDNKYAEILIKERSHGILRSKSNFKITHGVIGKQASKKTWYTFNISYLNGVFENSLIGWCNCTQNLELLWQSEAQAQKLEDYIQDSRIMKLNTKKKTFPRPPQDPCVSCRM